MLSLIKQRSADEFLEIAEPFLAQNEAANNLIYGVALRLSAEPGLVMQPPYLGTVHDEGALVCAALMTPPYRLVLYAPGLTQAPAEAPALAAAFDLLVADLEAGSWPLAGVTAEKAVAGLFAERWQRATNRTHRVQVQMRVFELREVVWPPLPPGRMRLAAAEDEALVFEWYCDFVREAVHGDPLPTPENVARSLSQGSIFLWDDGGPVCLVARGRRLPHGYSVGPVYTPPALRGRGYAAACTAAASQAILDGGAHYCTLFTDLANPTSNGIYQRIGYRPIRDYTEYTFEAMPA